MAGSSFQVASPASFRNEVEITPTAFCSPAGRSAFAIEAAALTSTNTGCQSSSAALRMARAEIGGAQLSTSTSAPEFLRMSTWVSIDISASMAMSATIMLAVIAEPFLQSPEQIAAELVVLPEHGDLAVRIGGLDVVGVDPPLGAERRLPAHRPGKLLRMRPLLVAGRDKELRDLLLVEISPRRQIARRAERAEHQEHVLLLDQITRLLDRRSADWSCRRGR